MKIVIDIDDNFYYDIVSNKYGIYKGRAYNIICNGTPLPKGHGDLIDRDEVLDCSYEIVSMYCEFDEVVNVTDIKEASTIIEADKEEKNG